MARQTWLVVDGMFEVEPRLATALDEIAADPNNAVEIVGAVHEAMKAEKP